VLPRSSLATVIAHELGQRGLGHRMDTTYAFFDQLLVDDKETFRHFGFAELQRRGGGQRPRLRATEQFRRTRINWRTPACSSGAASAPEGNPNLIAAHLGDKVATIADIKTAAAANANSDPKKNPQMIAALPIGGRVKLDVWYDRLDLIRASPWARLQNARKCRSR